MKKNAFLYVLTFSVKTKYIKSNFHILCMLIFCNKLGKAPVCSILSVKAIIKSSMDLHYIHLKRINSV